MTRPSTRGVVIASFCIALVIAGIVSFYASGHPDGLEFVAAQSGFADTAHDSPVAGGPLADYGVVGVENERLSGGLAGIIGTVTVLAIGVGLSLVLRRRRPVQHQDPED